MISYVISGKNIFISVNGNSKLISSDNKLYDQVLKLINEKAPDSEFEELFNQEDELKSECSKVFSNVEGITVGEDTILIDNVPVYGVLCDYIKFLYNENLPLDSVANFIRKLRKNPSYRIREQLWKFISASMENGGFTLDKDGNIIAYKVVSSNYKDKYTGTIDNKIGSVVTMNRTDVNNDPNITCSSGLHFCAYSYVSNFCDSIDHIMLVKVSPEDVVSIPTDYGYAKARCCKYEVIDEVKIPLNKPIYDGENEDKEENIDYVTSCEEWIDKASLKELVDLYENNYGELSCLYDTREKIISKLYDDASNYEELYDNICEFAGEDIGINYFEDNEIDTEDIKEKENLNKNDSNIDYCLKWLENQSISTLIELYEYMNEKKCDCSTREELVNKIISSCEKDFNTLKVFINGYLGISEDNDENKEECLCDEYKEKKVEKICIDWLNSANLPDLLAFGNNYVSEFDENDSNFQDREDIVAAIRNGFDTYSEMVVCLKDFME